MLNLIASASSDGTVKLWDFQFMHLDGIFSPNLDQDEPDGEVRHLGPQIPVHSP